MAIDINAELRHFSNKVNQKDKGAFIKTIAPDPSRPVKFAISGLTPLSKHMFDLKVEMSDKVQHPYPYCYAVISDPFKGLQIIGYHDGS